MLDTGAFLTGSMSTGAHGAERRHRTELVRKLNLWMKLLETEIRAVWGLQKAGQSLG